MAENTVDLRLNFDDSGVVKILESQEKLIKSQIESVKSLGNAYDEAFADVRNDILQYEQAIQESTSSIEAQDAAIKKSSSVQQAWNRILQEGRARLGEWGDALGQIQGQLRQVGSGLANSAKGASGFTGAIRLVGVALKGAGIGLVITALAGLVAFFARTQAGADKLAQIMSGLTAVFDVFVGRAAKIGGAIFGLITGQKSLSEAVNESAEAFKGVGKQMSNAFKEAQRIEKVYQELESATRRFTVSQSEANKRIAEYRANAEKLGEDNRKGLAFLRDANQEQLALNEKEAEIAKRRLKNITDELRLKDKSGTTDKQLLEDRAQALVEVNELEVERIELQSEYRLQVEQVKQREREQAEERRRQLEDLRNAYLKLFNDLEKRFDQSGIASLTGVEKLRAERDLAIEELLNFQRQLVDAAKKAKVTLPPEVSQKIDAIQGQIEDEFLKKATQFREETTFDLTPILDLDDKKIQEFRKKAEQAALNAASGIKNVFETPGIFGLIEAIKKAFELDDEQFDFVVSNFASAVGQIDDIILANTQQQINQNDALIESIQKRIDAAKSAFDEEKRLQEQGFANNTALREKELQEEQGRLQRALQERERLEKKAANQRLIADSVEQASQTALAVSRLIAAEASKGAIGLVIGAALVSTLLRIISNAKANAARANRPQQLRKGREFGHEFQGPSHEQNGIPVFAEGRIFEVEGGEILVGTKQSKQHRPFLREMMQGNFDNINLIDAVRHYKAMDHFNSFGKMARSGQATKTRIDANQSIAFAMLHQELVESRKENNELLKRLIELEEEKPVDTPLDRPIKRERKKKGVAIVEIITPG